MNCKCACLCAFACYKLRRPCFILSGGCCKCDKLSYNLYGVKNNFTNARYKLTIARRNFTNARYNYAGGHYKLTNARYNYTGGHYINNVADFIKLLATCKFQAANCFVLGTCRTEHGLDIGFNV